jgi:hypothetical protein
MGQQDRTGNQHDNQETDDDKGGPQHGQDQDEQPQQQKQPRYNAPGIKDNKNVKGKRNKHNRHQMAEECEKKSDRITQSNMRHREKQQRLMETIRAEMYAEKQESKASNTTTPTSSQTTSPITSRETSPSLTRKISRLERVDENIQDISTCMQQTGQVLQAARSALFKTRLK